MSLSCRDCGTMIDQYEDCVCKNCGLVNDICIDTTAEWRTYSSETTVRCGGRANMWVPNTQLNTYIKGGGNLGNVHNWTHFSTRDKNMIDTCREFDSIGRANGICDMTLNLAKEYYSLLYDVLESQQFGTKRCSVRRPLKMACLYFASKNCGFPCQIKEVAAWMKVPLKDTSKACNTFLDLIGDKIGPIEVIKPIHYVQRLQTQLGLDGDQQELLEKLLRHVDSADVFPNSTPLIVVSSCLYYFIKKGVIDVSKEQLQNVCGVSLGNMGKFVAKLESLDFE